MTPTLSDAVAETFTAAPETLALFAGAVIETAGGVVSPMGLFTVMVTAIEVAEFPAASRAVAVRACEALETVVEFNVTE